MAEPLGLIGVIGVAVQLVQLSTNLGLDWKDAPAEASTLIRELQSLKTVLCETHVNFISNPDFVDAFRGRHSALLSECDPLYDTDTMAVVSACERELKGLLEDLDKKAAGYRLGWERLKGAFQAPNLRGAVEDLHRRCLALNKLLQIDTAAMTASIHREVKEARKEQRQQHHAQSRALEYIRERVDDEDARRERETILDWLCPAGDALQQSDLRRRRQPGTGQWLLDAEEFQTWITTPNKTLFCPGIPGAGKTMLSSIVIDHLTTRFGDQPDVGIAYMYCNFCRHDDQTAEALLANFLKQLAQQLPALPAVVRELYEKYASRSGLKPPVEALSDGLRSVVAEYERVWIVIDALDECQAAERCRARLLDEVLALQSAQGVSANVFATSRPISDVVQRFHGVPSLEIRASREDVESYLRGHMGELADFVARRQDLQDEVVAGVADAADGILISLSSRFLLAKLSFQVLNRTYDETMERINGQLDALRELAMLVLSWITCATRPLIIRELQHALAVEPGDKEFDHDNFPEVDDVVSVCAGLVTVEEESGIIRLVHYTTQEYLERTQNRWFPNAEDDIALRCVTYLSLSNFDSGLCKSFEDLLHRLRSYPLFQYAASSWAHHTKRASTVCDAVLSFLRSEAHSRAASQVMNGHLARPGRHRPLGHYGGLPGLHLAAHFGVTSAVNELLKIDGVDVNASNRSFFGLTPLMVAANNGQLASVQALLAAEGIDHSPIHLAANGGYLGVIRLLIATDQVDVQSPTLRRAQTPFSIALTRGYREIAQALLDTGKINLELENSLAHCRALLVVLI
ncbi:hypothetical protein C8A05DRAFT_46455 [Staphylotrichum tortipilum]|uniref:Ankyrin repeat protein n=1 Tax=Staphylotrichum tortipilum TaxID=2831512 RepID=A0AAN6MFZ6_9PEZI|nr:hypothetical protein C8A05DRAFT_46455 [Staphylotrichum longicolle]